MLRAQPHENDGAVMPGSPRLTSMIDRIYCHIVWGTRDRAPLIDAGLARFRRLLQRLKGGSATIASKEHHSTENIHDVVIAAQKIAVKIAATVERLFGRSA